MIGDCVTRILGTIGDVNPIDYSGGYIYARKDRPEASEESATAEIEYIEPPEGRGSRQTWDCPTCEGNGTGPCESPPYAYTSEEHHAIRCRCETCDGFGEWVCVTCKGTGEDPSLRWTVYRVSVENDTWIDWKSVAESCGQPANYYHETFASGETLAMARAIWDAALVWGWYQFDSEPLQLTRAEVEARCATFDAIEAIAPRQNIGFALACAGYAATFRAIHRGMPLGEAYTAIREFLGSNPEVKEKNLAEAFDAALRAAQAGED